jgi:hypothetical protein
MVVSISNPLDVPIELSVACSRAELSQTTICSRLDPGQSGNLQLILTNVTGSTVSGVVAVMQPPLDHLHCLHAASPLTCTNDSDSQQNT